MFNPRVFLSSLALLSSASAFADIERVYHPYVELGEREIEYGAVLYDTGTSDQLLLQKLGFGYSWTDRLFTEVYALKESLTHHGEEIRSYEAELKLQLTEQGEYWADWGLLVEVGSSSDISSHDIAVGLLIEKELSNDWVAAINGIAEYEFGDDINNEFETALRAQLRYRYGAFFEPAFEVYLDDKDWVAGPSLLGAYGLSGRKKIRWELGVFFGLDEDTPSTNVRANMEFEF